MQVYRELRVLTARPTPEDEARVPHAPLRRAPGGGAGQRRLVARCGAGGDGRGARGGAAADPVPAAAGCISPSLTEGLADIPDPGPAARAEARALLTEIGPAALHARLAEADPATAARLRPTDSQRVARAWEVWRGTGTGLAAWQASARRARRRGASPPSCSTRRGRSCVRRSPRASTAMLRGGALDEVRALLALGLDPALPAMRAHGVPELAAHLRGELTLARRPADRIELVTGQYTKRQATWFRHHELADPSMHRIRSMRDARSSDAIFGKKRPRSSWHLLKAWLDAPQPCGLSVRPSR